MATTLPVVVDVTAKNDGKAAAGISEIGRGIDRFNTSADRMAKGLDQVLARLQKMGTEGAKAGQAAAKSLEDAAKAAQRAAQLEIQARRVAAAEARNSLLAEAAARQKAAAERAKASAEDRSSKRAQVAAAKELEQAEARAAAAAVKAARDQARASKEAEAAAKKLRDQVEQSSQAAAVGFAAAAAVLGGLAGAVLNTSSQFEVMLTRLQTVQGSAAVAMQTFRDSVDYAAKTPFDVRGIVDATVTLEVYGQRSQEVLPRVAALAAGMGKDLGATALVVGKALSGSLEGFESLRNEYGITTRELKRFGAETLTTGGILTATGAQAEKAAKAFTTIIDTRFGDAIERQAQTLTGQLSNLGDQVTSIVADVGAGAAGLVKQAVAPANFLLGLVRDLPGPIKALAGAALAVAAGVAAVGAAGAAAGAGLLLVNTQLVAAATAMPAMAGAAAASTAAVGAMSAAFTAVGGAVSFLLSPLGLLAASLLAVRQGYGAAADASAEMGRQIAADSANYQKQAADIRDLANATREYENTQRIKKGLAPLPEGAQSTETQRIAELKGLLDTASTSEFFRVFKEIGLDAETVKKKIGEYEGTLKAQGEAADKLREKLAVIREGDKQAAINSGVAFDPASYSPRAKAVAGELATEERKVQNTREYLDALRDVGARYDQNATSLEKIGQLTASAEDFTKYAKASGDLKSLNEAYGINVQRLGQVRAELEKLQQPTDQKAVQRELLKLPEDSELRGRLQAYLDQIKVVKDLEKDINEKRADGPKKEIQALQQALAERKSLNQASAADELASLAQQLELAKTLTHGKEAEITRITSEQTQARQRARKQEADDEKALLEKRLNEAKDLPVAARSKGSAEDNKGTAESVAAYDAAISRVQAYLKELNRLRAAGEITKTNFEAMGKAGNAALETLQIGRAADDAARLAKNLSEFKDELSSALADAERTGLADQLRVVEQAILDLKVRQKSADVDSGEAAKELTALGRQKLDLEQAITVEKLRQAGDLQALAIAGLQQEIELLELRKQAGFSVEEELTAKKAELRQAQLDDLKNKYDQEVAAAGENSDAKLAIDRKYLLQKHQLEKSFAIEREREFLDGQASTPAPSGSAPSSPTRQSRPNQAGSSSGGGNGQPAPVVSGPGGVQTVNAYESGIGASGFGGSARTINRAERDAERKAAQRAAFDRGNPGVLSAMREQDLSRNEQLATTIEAQRKAGRATQARAAEISTAAQAEAIAAQDKDNEALRAEAWAAVERHRGRFGQLERFGTPDGAAQRMADQAAARTATGNAPPAKASEGASGQAAGGKSSGEVAKTVTVNQKFDASINFPGGGFAKIDASLDSPLGKAVVAICEAKFRQEGLFDAGKGAGF